MKKSATTALSKPKTYSPWLIKALLYLFSHSPLSATVSLISTPVSLKRLLALPDDAARIIFSYFTPRERDNLLVFKPINRFYIFNQQLLDQLKVEQIIDTFSHLMTLHRPYNCDRAATMFKKHPHHVQKMIAKPRIMQGNAAGQFTQPISAYEYAWCVNDEAMCLLLQRHMSEGVKNKLSQECEGRALEKFMYLLTREGEDNQNKAEAMLEKYPHLVTKLISTQIDTRDTARHFLKKMSAYEYAYWSGDTLMRAMLNQYLERDKDLKERVSTQCKIIAEDGIAYEMIASDGKPIPNSKVVLSSKHFSYSPLLAAYDDYFQEVDKLNNAGKVLKNDWQKARELWCKVGLEWSKVPISGLQEMCAPYAFAPLETYLAKHLSTSEVRTVTFQYVAKCKAEYLVYQGTIHPELGRGFSIYKCNGQPFRDGWAVTDDGYFVPKSVKDDRLALAQMAEVRTDKNLKQTLDYLSLRIGVESIYL